ncbi:MAG: glycerol-3-phosphate acyltransferase [Chloroflexi bacterium]|nr:glycerol-3-phosphate acyltransferase [Chloroflexota bacterium]
MNTLWLWVAAGFLSGSLPFAVWIGRWALRKEITHYGDANPGATNVLRAGGRWSAALVLLLDILKAALPVGSAYLAGGLDDWRLVPVALAPLVGHAFSPWLGFRGGKAIATTAGMWAALTLWSIPTVSGVSLLLFTQLVGANGWAVLGAYGVVLVYLLLTPHAFDWWAFQPATPILLAIWAGSLLVLLYRHRADLAHPPLLRRRKRP